MNSCSIDRALLFKIIQELKTLELHKYDDYGKLIGCVVLLEKALNNSQEETKAEEVSK